MAKEKVKDEFTAYAEEVARQEAEAAASRGKGSGGGFQGFEKIKFTGLEKGKQKILRPLGSVPNSGKTPTTSRTVRIATIISDDGKTIKVRYPTNPLDAEQWILTRIVDRVTAVDWIKGPDGKNIKVSIQEKKNPDIFDMVKYNGLEASNNKRKFGAEGKGWYGREMFLMNVIDRDPTQYAWSRENKHTMLLSKNVNVVESRDGSGMMEFADDGVPAYGFTELLSRNLFKTYGSWENYDISVERTGQTSPAMIVTNASKHLEEIAEELQDFVVEGPLTDEEKSWEQYDLDKLYGPSSYSKLFDKLKLSIAKIDTALGTHYLTELEALKKKEQVERDAANVAQAAEGNTENPPEGFPAPNSAPEELPGGDTEDLSSTTQPGSLDKLGATERAQIVSWIKAAKGWKIGYTDDADPKQYACPRCGTNAPANFPICPDCGTSF